MTHAEIEYRERVAAAEQALAAAASHQNDPRDRQAAAAEAITYAVLALAAATLVAGDRLPARLPARGVSEILHSPIMQAAAGQPPGSDDGT